jgi:ketosteroid isomerase-like protein
MTSNDDRAAILVRALRAAVDGDRRTMESCYTDDVQAWTPALSTTSRAELLDELDHRDGAFTELALEVTPLDVGGDYAAVEWSLTMNHTGVLRLGGGTAIEPTGLRVTVRGVTVAEFGEDRICGLRQYWDEFAVLEQLGVLTNPA